MKNISVPLIRNVPTKYRSRKMKIGFRDRAKMPPVTSSPDCFSSMPTRHDLPNDASAEAKISSPMEFNPTPNHCQAPGGTSRTSQVNGTTRPNESSENVNTASAQNSPTNKKPSSNNRRKPVLPRPTASGLIP